MIRPQGKPKKIAYAILGVPDNMKKEKNAQKKKRINKRLVFEETSRVR